MDAMILGKKLVPKKKKFDAVMDFDAGTIVLKFDTALQAKTASAKFQLNYSSSKETEFDAELCFCRHCENLVLTGFRGHKAKPMLKRILEFFEKVI